MYNACMTVALQIRDVPEDVRDALAAAAAQRGQSVQAYLLSLVIREVRAMRSAAAFDANAAARAVLPPELSLTAMIREGRDQGFDLDRT